MLDSHPEIVVKICEEQERVVEEYGTEYTMEILKEGAGVMPYLEAGKPDSL